jgi:RNA-directed DNA polymerase
MTQRGDSLESLAMRSSAVAAGFQSRMRASSISTTTGPTTRTTTSASADPRNNGLDVGTADGRQTLGRESPGAQVPKARQHAHPKTAALPTGCAVESGAEFYRLTTLDNLWNCWEHARSNKSGRLRIQRFAEDPLGHLITIQNRLRERRYTFGPYKVFTVREKKFRDVVDAPMKDRIVHWLIYQYLLPIWQPRFIHDTYGNLPGRGTHAAIRRLAQFARGEHAEWVLQLDISKYFYSVNHALLKERALRYIGDHELRMLMISLIDSFRTDGSYDHLFAESTLYRQTPDRGMPIGNLTSQLFANIFLNDFDHWVKETLRVKRYVRYVDDMAILGESREQLQDLCVEITTKLASEGLTIHPHKIRIAPTRAGVPFLGSIVWPNHVSAGRYIRSRYLHRIRQHESGARDRTEALCSYRAMFKHTGATR